MVIKKFLVAWIILACFCATTIQSRSNYEQAKNDANMHTSDTFTAIQPGDLRPFAVHDAGDLYSVLGYGMYSTGWIGHWDFVDPETGEPLYQTTFPADSQKYHLFGGGLWIGGIVGNDTMVTTAMDGWFSYVDVVPESSLKGGTIRTANFADDEFVTTFYDSHPIEEFDFDHEHNPLGVKVTQTSSSWADSLYDNFILVEYTIENFGGKNITDGWIGFYLDADIYFANENIIGYNDDCSGLLSFEMEEGNSATQTYCGYSIDNDGNPNESMAWDESSIRSAISFSLLDQSFDIERTNFNWWYSNNIPAYDFGPRLAGTPEDPFYSFPQGNLGTPVNDADKYYVLSHPEQDYPTLETALDHTAEGWLPPPQANQVIDFANGYDTRFLYSFGPFDLGPGDSIRFVVALVAGRDVHTGPDDFQNLYDPMNPMAFENTLDFSDVIEGHRRAYAVYQSGKLLPIPGPPQGIRITNYDTETVSLAWMPSGRPDVAGYYINFKDTLISHNWYHVNSTPMTDTTGIFNVINPTHSYMLAVSLVDWGGRESLPSIPVEVIPAMPHAPIDIALVNDNGQPLLSWQPYVNGDFHTYLIYRAVWDGSFELYDSTVAFSYRDMAAESGVKYSYRLQARNESGLVSAISDPVEIILMAMDQGLLFFEFNSAPGNAGAGPFKHEYVDSLFESIASITSIDRLRYTGLNTGFKQMADYSTIIFEWEQREAGIWPTMFDSIGLYLENGGRAVFILLGTEQININDQRVVYQPGDFFHDFLFLDSAVNHGSHFDGSYFYGDLMGCKGIDRTYVDLAADEDKLAESLIPVSGYIPMSGYLYPRDEVDILYRYRSSNPDTVHNGAANGIRYRGDDYGFVFFDFPLTLMQQPASYYALRQALIDMGVDMSCGDVYENNRVDMGDIVFLINYLFRSGPPPGNPEHADVDCSGTVNLGDVVTLINFLFIKGGWLNCCH